MQRDGLAADRQQLTGAQATQDTVHVDGVQPKDVRHLLLGQLQSETLSGGQATQLQPVV